MSGSGDILLGDTYRAAAHKSTSSPETVAMLRALEERLLVLEAYAYMALLSQHGRGEMPVTSFAKPISGDEIGANNRYLPAYTNDTKHAVAVQVAATWAAPGVGVKLSLSDDVSDAYKVDKLANVANGYSESIVVLLRPGQTLYLNTHDTAFALTSGDLFQIRVFDPLDIVRVALER